MKNDHLKAKRQQSRNFFGHNFGIVYRFEVIRMLKKKTFWISIIVFPLLLALIFGITFLASYSSFNDDKELKDNSFKIALTDNSELISAELVSSLNATPIASLEEGIKAVKSGQYDVYFYFPNDLTTDKLQIYGQNISLFENSQYGSIASFLLKNSASTSTDPNTVAVLSDNINSDSHFYDANGDEVNLLGDMIVPAAFLVLFYLIICVFSSQMLTATVEEKENRITEMLLTTINAKTLITGKIFAFITLVLLQAIIIIGLVITGYLIAAHYIDLPSMDLSLITFDPMRIAIGAALFIVSILMYSGIIVAIGAATPTAKEANSFMSIPILLMLAPLYIFSTVISEPNSPVVLALAFFPLTAPILLMTLNALGTLSIGHAVIGLVIMTLTTAIIFIIAAKLFQTGAIEYHRRIQLFSRKAKRKNS